jgi:hypothetical protein
MFFNIDSDTGDAISGWIAPDNPSVAPRIAILVPGRAEVLFEANVHREDVRELGLHASGQVGFVVSDAVVPGIANVDDIEIVEADTRIPVYRRFKPDRHLERKLFLFDSSVMPQRRIIQNIAERFALNYANSERYSLETMIVLLNNHFSKSLFFCGRSNFSRYASFLENGGYIRAALLREPLQELAERLLFLSLLSRTDAGHLLPHYTTGLAPLIGFAKDLKFNDQRALLSAFRQINDEQRQALTSPMVRMLGCSVDEMPTHNNVSLALDHLSSLDVVGTRSRYPLFKALLGQFVGGDVLGPEQPTTLSAVQALAETLSRLGIVLDLLEHDIALYAYVEEAVAQGLMGGHQLIARATHTI